MRVRAILLGLLLTTSAACASRIEAPRPPPTDAPILPHLVVAGRGAVLHLDDDRSVRLAYPRVRLPLRVREARKDEALVEIDGGIRVSGVVKLSDLGVVVCEPGPLGERVYAGNGNLLGLRSTVHDGQVRVAGTVVVRQRAYDEKIPFDAQFRSIPFEADMASTRLCEAPPPKRHAGTSSDPEIAHGVGEPDEEDFPKTAKLVDIEPHTTLALLDAPGGTPVHTLPASEWGFVVVALERRGAWDLVAIGDGPYMLGWIPAHAPRPDSPTGGLGLLGAMVDLPGPMALHTKKLAGRPLHRLPAGTEIQQRGVVRARLVLPGFARVVGPPRDGWSYVVAAVDDDVTVEGWVAIGSLGERIESPPTATK